jgi:hypothetical protein
MTPRPSLEGYFNTTQTKRFVSPTRLFWGPGTRDLAVDAMEGARAILLVVDEVFSNHPEVLSLASRLPVCHRVRVAKEPDSATLEATISKLPSALDGLLCIGGGSTLDSGKAIRAYLAYGTWAVKDRPTIPSMPKLVAVPTTAASGSEMSRYYVVADGQTHEKRAYRSWSLAPDIALLDPVWLDSIPGPLRFAGALDAFTHLYESLLCRQEHSWLNDALCREGLARLRDLAPALMESDPLPSEDAVKLQYAAALGGLALSNVRTGMLHDAGEALAAQVDLPHPLTLRVFLPALLDMHQPVLAEGLGDLAGGPAPSGDPSSAMGWRNLWIRGSQTWGLDARIHATFSASPHQAEPIVAKILSDRVLVEKESPVPLDEASVRAFVARGLDGFSANRL